MANYCTVEDVLRVLGGTLKTVQMHFTRQLWDGAFPVTATTVDGNTFDVPDTLLTRIGKQIEFATGRINNAVFAAYKSQPTTIPSYFVLACAQIAALNSVTDDGVRTDYLRKTDAEVKVFFDRIAKWELDLGIPAPRPPHRTPAVGVVRVGGGAGSARRRSCGGC